MTNELLQQINQKIFMYVDWKLNQQQLKCIIINWLKLAYTLTCIHQAKKKKLYYAFVVVRWALRNLGVDDWLICTVMALYTEACTVVRTDAGLSESFEVKVGLHQGSVLSPLLFAAVMDVVSSDARSGLPSKLLYADDLVIMAPTMEQPGRWVADWRASLLGKGLKVNA